MRPEDRLLERIAATRNRSDGFAVDKQSFLRRPPDHFAIALANAQVYEELRQAYHDLRANQRQIIQSPNGCGPWGKWPAELPTISSNHLTGVLAFLEMAAGIATTSTRNLRSWLQMSFESSLAAASKSSRLLPQFLPPPRCHLRILRAGRISIELAAETISLTRPRWHDMPRQHGIWIVVKCMKIWHDRRLARAGQRRRSSRCG